MLALAQSVLEGQRCEVEEGLREIGLACGVELDADSVDKAAESVRLLANEVGGMKSKAKKAKEKTKRIPGK